MTARVLAILAAALLVLASGEAFGRTLDKKPDIFGSTAIAVNQTPLDGRWQSALRGNLSARQGPWTEFITTLKGQSRSQQVAAVNSWVNNRVRFTPDSTNHGTADVWSDAARTLLTARGDCEDYAIAKLHILRALGVNMSDLYLVIGRDRALRTDHAVLAVLVDGRFEILDNLTDRILVEPVQSDFLPTFSYSSAKAWLHGMPRRKPVVIASR